MTAIITVPTREVICMASDEIWTMENGTYRTEEKVLELTDVGCITTWGSGKNNVVINKPIEIIQSKSIVDAVMVIEDLLRQQTSKVGDEELPDEVGYHIAGFTTDNSPSVHHVFWGTNRPKLSFEKPAIRIHDHSYMPSIVNGQNIEIDKQIVKRLRYSNLSKNLLGLIEFINGLFFDLSKAYLSIGGIYNVNLIFTNNEIISFQNNSEFHLRLDSSITQRLENTPLIFNDWDIVSTQPNSQSLINIPFDIFNWGGTVTAYLYSYFTDNTSNNHIYDDSMTEHIRLIKHYSNKCETCLNLLITLKSYGI